MFYKLKYAKTYDAMLSTPLGVGDVALGEVTWALTRGAIYAVGFMVVMLLLGLVRTPWALVAVPASLLIGFAAAGVGTAATSSCASGRTSTWCSSSPCRSSCSAPRSFPITTYPEPLRTIVELTPLYRGVHLLRGLATAKIEPMLLVDMAYLIVLGAIGVWITSRRLGRLLLK